MGCFPSRQIVKTEYIRPEIPPIPAEPAYYPVAWQYLEKEGLYCLTREGSVNLLKNVELMKNRQRDLESILLDLKQRK